MKRTTIFLFTTVLLLTVLFVSCKKTHVIGVTIEPSTVHCFVGDTQTVTATVIPENADNKTVYWSSDNPAIASVTDGIITANAAGQATIKAISEDGNKSAKCFVFAYTPFEIEMVDVEGSTFIMGCTDDECNDDELPHHVQLSSFKISKYQITQEIWRCVMGNNPSLYKGDDLPLHFVTWNNVQEFIRILNVATGKRYRLPTEAEWEYAARGGNKSMGYKYSGSNNIDEVAWYLDNSNGIVHPVGEKKPNELGIYDMSGNVREWCLDGKRFYTNEHQINPQGPSDIVRVLRGGDVIYPSEYCRVSARFCWNQANAYYFNGFRLVLPEDEKQGN